MTPKLLLADDSVTIQRVIELTFADEDVQVMAVGDGRQAIEQVTAHKPDIVLADIGMPERDGYEVTAFIKSNPELAHIPVLLLTGAFEPVDEVRARAVGCDGVLVKPFEPQIVISRVRDLLSRSKAGRTAGVSVATPVAAGPPQTPTQEAVTGAAEGPRKTGGAIEDYFDRLDVAFTTLSTTAGGGRRSAHADAFPADDTRESAAQSDAGRGAQPAILPLADAFAALLAAEEGQSFTLPPIQPQSVSEELIDVIAERVIARMGDEPMRRAVLDAAERLVREEIERIKSR